MIIARLRKCQHATAPPTHHFAAALSPYDGVSLHREKKIGEITAIKVLIQCHSYFFFNTISTFGRKLWAESFSFLRTTQFSQCLDCDAVCNFYNQSKVKRPPCTSDVDLPSKHRAIWKSTHFKKRVIFFRYSGPACRIRTMHERK